MKLRTCFKFKTTCGRKPKMPFRLKHYKNQVQRGSFHVMNDFLLTPVIHRI